MSYDTVYECELLSITPDIRVNKDWDRCQNIENADTVVVKKIMVQQTSNKYVYKEIITGIKIPVYRITYAMGFFRDFDEPKKVIPKNPVFIKITEKYLSCKHSTTLKEAQAKDVKKYIEQNATQTDKFKDELQTIFRNAEEYYTNAEKKNNFSNEASVKALLKSLRKK